MKEMVAKTKEPQRRLKETEIGKYWPLAKTDKGLQEFCDFLSTRFGSDRLTPMGFIQLVANTTTDLQRGKDGRNNNAPIDHPAAGYDTMFYGLFLGFIPSLAEAIFEPKFAAQVLRDWERVQARRRQQK